MDVYQGMASAHRYPLKLCQLIYLGHLYSLNAEDTRKLVTGRREIDSAIFYTTCHGVTTNFLPLFMACSSSRLQSQPQPSCSLYLGFDDVVHPLGWRWNVPRVGNPSKSGWCFLPFMRSVASFARWVAMCLENFGGTCCLVSLDWRVAPGESLSGLE